MNGKKTSALYAVLLASTACSALDKLITIDQSPPFATISMNALAKGNGYVTAPGAFFYRAVDNTNVSITVVDSVRNTCGIRPVGGSGPVSVVTDTMPTAASPLSAGAFVSLQLSGLVDTLLAPSSQSVGYKLPPSQTRPFTPGDVATFAFPGDPSGFPAASVSIQTAEAFTLAPVVFAPSGQDVQVNWTPATSPGSAMNFTITYSVGPSSTQIYCQFVDDGQAVVPAGFFATFPNAVAGAQIQGVDAIRLRATLVQPAHSTATVNVISVFEVPTPVSP